jgi:hypothetical protein
MVVLLLCGKSFGSAGSNNLYNLHYMILTFYINARTECIKDFRQKSEETTETYIRNTVRITESILRRI